MGLKLRDNIHWCVCAGRAVFLDVDDDRYFCLSKAANEEFLKLASGDTEEGYSTSLKSIIARGILVECEASSNLPPPPTIPAPANDLIHNRHRPPFAGIIRALYSDLHVSFMLKGTSLKRAFRTVTKHRPVPATDSSTQLRLMRDTIAAFETAAFLTRSHNRCLARGLAVHAACRRIGISSKLVMGVTANPFTAHCWVQLGSTVLVGGFEQARLYTPILVAE